MPRKSERKTTKDLIRAIVVDMNRTVSVKRLAKFYGVTHQWIYTMAARLRQEGFKIPARPAGMRMYTRAWKLIDEFKGENLDLLDGNFAATIYIDDRTYYLNAEETKRLLELFPKIATPAKRMKVPRDTIGPTSLNIPEKFWP